MSVKPPLALLLFLLFSPSLVGQTPKVVVPFTGSQAFAHILNHFGLQPLQQPSDLAGVKPEETLIVLFGDMAFIDHLQTHVDLPKFLQAGGAWLLASDRPDMGRLKPWKLSIDGKAVVAIRFVREGYMAKMQSPFAYRGLSECPLVVQGIRDSHPIFKGLGKGLATNRPSYVKVLESDFHILAGFSEDCEVKGPFENNIWMAFLSLSENDAFLVGSPGYAKPAGRTLIMAGHSVFMNGMMAQPDNDNFLFAWNCIRWLSEAPGENKRKYVLFIDDGRLITDLNLPLAVTIPPPPPPTAVINGLLRGLEEEGFFHRLLYHSVPGSHIGRLVLLTCFAILLAVGARRLLYGRHKLDVAVPLPNPHAGLALASVTLLAQRQQAQKSQNNYWETAQVLAQQFFLEAVPGLRKGSTFATLVQEAPSDTGPLQAVADGWWQRWRLQRRLRWWWQLACGPGGRIKTAQLRRLDEELVQMKKALAAGDITWEFSD